MRALRRLVPALPYVLAFVVGFLLVGAGMLAAQDTPVAPTNASGPVALLAYAGLLAVVGWYSTRVYDGIKTIIPWWDKRPAAWHQIAAPAVQFLLGAMASASGAAALTDFHAIDAGVVGGLLNMLLAAGIKRAEKAKAPADATVVMERSRDSELIG